MRVLNQSDLPLSSLSLTVSVCVCVYTIVNITTYSSTFYLFVSKELLPQLFSSSSHHLSYSITPDLSAYSFSSLSNSYFLSLPVPCSISRSLYTIHTPLPSFSLYLSRPYLVISYCSLKMVSMIVEKMLI